MADWEQQRVPLWDALHQQVLKKQISFHTPGHKHGALLDPEFLMEVGNTGLFDLTEIPGLDNLHFPQDVIKESQALAAAACGAVNSFFLVNGASCGINAMILASCEPGDKIIIPRNAHLSIHNAIVLAGLQPVYVYPDSLSPWEIPLGIEPEQFEEALAQAPDSRAALFINPLYHGICADLPELVRMAREKGLQVLVDEAHGAHFPFHPQLPPSTGEMGADYWVQSTHKTGLSLTQSALLHIGSNVNPAKVQNALAMVQSTSPSYLLLASLDLSRRTMATKGKELLTVALESVRELREHLQEIPGIKCLQESDLPGMRLDPLKVTLQIDGLSGYQASELFAENYNVQPELAAETHVLFSISPGNSRDELIRLEAACREISGKAGQNSPILSPETRQDAKDQEKISSIHWPRCRQVLLPREAWFAKTREVPVSESVGQVAARSITRYPPGIPLVCPGEEISPEMAEQLSRITKTVHIVK